MTLERVRLYETERRRSRPEHRAHVDLALRVMRLCAEHLAGPHSAEDERIAEELFWITRFSMREITWERRRHPVPSVFAPTYYSVG